MRVCEERSDELITAPIPPYVRSGKERRYFSTTPPLRLASLVANTSLFTNHFTCRSLFGKVMSEKAVELEIEIKATVTTWAFSYFPITLTMPTRKEAYTCRQVNASTICDVGTLDQFEEISCVSPNEYPIQDPTVHSIDFIPSPSPNSIKVRSCEERSDSFRSSLMSMPLTTHSLLVLRFARRSFRRTSRSITDQTLTFTRIFRTALLPCTQRTLCIRTPSRTA